MSHGSNSLSSLYIYDLPICDLQMRTLSTITFYAENVQYQVKLTGLLMSDRHVGGRKFPLAAGKTPISCSRGLNWNTGTLDHTKQTGLTIGEREACRPPFLPAWSQAQSRWTCLWCLWSLRRTGRSGTGSTTSRMRTPIKSNRNS